MEKEILGKAALRMSLARRRSRTSRSDSEMRAASSLEVPGFEPASMSACLSQPRNDSTPTPNCLAIRGTTPKLWPPCSATASLAIRTARSLSSGGIPLL
jgi:hypothetical protein